MHVNKSDELVSDMSFIIMRKDIKRYYMKLLWKKLNVKQYMCFECQSHVHVMKETMWSSTLSSLYSFACQQTTSSSFFSHFDESDSSQVGCKEMERSELRRIRKLQWA